MAQVIMLIFLLRCTKLANFFPTECGFRCVGRSYNGAQTFEKLIRQKQKCNVKVHLFTLTYIGIKVIGCHFLFDCTCPILMYLA